METSAKNGTNVQEIFIEASKILYKEFLNYELTENNKNKNNLKLAESIYNNNNDINNDEKNNTCC